MMQLTKFAIAGASILSTIVAGDDSNLNDLQPERGLEHHSVRPVYRNRNGLPGIPNELLMPAGPPGPAAPVPNGRDPAQERDQAQEHQQPRNEWDNYLNGLREASTRPITEGISLVWWIVTYLCYMGVGYCVMAELERTVEKWGKDKS